MSLHIKGHLLSPAQLYLLVTLKSCKTEYTGLIPVNYIDNINYIKKFVTVSLPRSVYYLNMWIIGVLKGLFYFNHTREIQNWRNESLDEEDQ
uniref:Putative ovule protein n=1 Tax=Solanum chacoense TaxID=4108 RepID=A0A0V0HIH4_SOLCH